MKSLVEFLNEALLNEGKSLVKPDSDYKKCWNELFKLLDKDYDTFKKYLNDQSVQKAAIKDCKDEEGIKELVKYFCSDAGYEAVQGVVYDAMVMDIEDEEIDPDDPDWVKSGLWFYLGMGMWDTDGEFIMSFSDYCDDNGLSCGDNSTELNRALHDAIDKKYHVMDESVNESKKEKIRARRSK